MTRSLSLLVTLSVVASVSADDPAEAVKHYNRGCEAEAKGLHDQAIADFTLAIQSDPKMFGAFLNRGVRWQDKAEFDKAIADYTAAMQLGPKVTRPLHGRMHCWLAKKEFGKAIRDAERVLEIDAKYPDALNLLGWTYATCPDANHRDGKKAMECARKASESDPKNVQLRQTLAAAHAEAGDFDAAVKEQQKALDDKGLGKEERKAAEERLELYKAKKPFRTAK